MSNIEKMEALVKQLAEVFPALGLSFGYIGNLERWGDDRGWRVFTKLHTDSGCSISFDLGDTASLEKACRLGTRMRLVTFAAKTNSQQ